MAPHTSRQGPAAAAVTCWSTQLAWRAVVVLLLTLLPASMAAAGNDTSLSPVSTATFPSNAPYLKGNELPAGTYEGLYTSTWRLVGENLDPNNYTMADSFMNRTRASLAMSYNWIVANWTQVAAQSATLEPCPSEQTSRSANWPGATHWHCGLPLAAILPACRASQAAPIFSCHASSASQQQHMVVPGTHVLARTPQSWERMLHVPFFRVWNPLLGRVCCLLSPPACTSCGLMTRKGVPYCQGHLSCRISDSSTHHPTLSMHVLQTRTARRTLQQPT